MAVRCILTLRNGARRSSLTNLSWAWFDEIDPQSFTSPTDTGTIETTDVNGLIEVTLSGSTLNPGEEGCLAVMTSDNTDMGLYRLMVQ